MHLLPQNSHLFKEFGKRYSILQKNLGKNMTEHQKNEIQPNQISQPEDYQLKEITNSTSRYHTINKSDIAPETTALPDSKSQSSDDLESFFKTLKTGLIYLKRIVPWIWLTVLIVVIIPLIGQLFIAKAFQTQSPSPSQATTPTITTQSAISTPQSINWMQVEKAVKESMQEARETAEVYAAKELDEWTQKLVERVDSNFLDWYFGYFNQKQIEYSGFFTGISANIAGWLNPNNATPQARIAEAITEDFQIEFAKRVLVPEISQLQLQTIASQTSKRYLNALKVNLIQIPEQQQIPRADWESYLKGASVDVKDTEGKILANLGLQKIVAGGAYVALKPLLLPLLPKIGSAVVAKLAGKAGAKIATKTGSILGGQIGSGLLDCTIGVGILIWDIWETNHSASIEKPILRQNLVDYLHTVQDSLLTNPNNGIMTAVNAIDRNILQAIDIAKSVTVNKLGN